MAEQADIPLITDEDKENDEVSIIEEIRPIGTQITILLNIGKYLFNRHNQSPDTDITDQLGKASRIFTVAYALAMANDVSPERKYEIALLHGKILCHLGQKNRAILVYKHTGKILRNSGIDLTKLWMHIAIALGMKGNIIEAYDLIDRIIKD